MISRSGKLPLQAMLWFRQCPERSTMVATSSLRWWWSSLGYTPWYVLFLSSLYCISVGYWSTLGHLLPPFFDGFWFPLLFYPFPSQISIVFCTGLYYAFGPVSPKSSWAVRVRGVVIIMHFVYFTLSMSLSAIPLHVPSCIFCLRLAGSLAHQTTSQSSCKDTYSGVLTPAQLPAYIPAPADNTPTYAHIHTRRHPIFRTSTPLLCLFVSPPIFYLLNSFFRHQVFGPGQDGLRTAARLAYHGGPK